MAAEQTIAESGTGRSRSIWLGVGFVIVAVLALMVYLIGMSESRTLELTFDGESCIYDGPSQLSPGDLELAFHNNSADVAWVDFVKLDEGLTTEDLENGVAELQAAILAGAEVPEGRPPWTTGVWTALEVPAGEQPKGTATLDPGVYGVACGPWAPYFAHYGGGFAVES